MPEGTRVHDCVDKLKGSKGLGHAIAICQSSTHQSYHTGLALEAADRKHKKKKHPKKHHKG